MGRGRQWPGAVQLLSRTLCPGAGTRSTIHHCCCCCCHSTGREKPPVSVAGAHQPSPAHATVAGPIKLDRQMFCHQSQRTGWAGLGSCLTFPVNISSLQPRLHTAPQPLHIGTLDTSPAEQCSAQPIPRLTNNASLLQDPSFYQYSE